MATPNLTPLLPSMNHSAPALDPLRIPGESMELHSLENLSEHSKRNLPTSPSTPFLRSPGGGVYHPKHAPSMLRTLWVVAALLVLSLSYLIFCYIVDHKLVKVSLYNVDVSVSRMNIIKAGVTSINILIITVALLPLRSLVGDLQGEEFFRVLTLKRRGVPLSVVNQVSTPSYGFSDKLGAVLRRQSSGVFAGAFVASLIAIIASTLAPATLSVQVVQVDDELQAFRVGAIFRQSVWNVTEEGVYTAKMVPRRTGYAAVLPWVETNLKATYNWGLPEDGPDGSLYAIPTPIDVPVQKPIRYVTDLIKIQPSCKWHAPDLSNVTGTTNYSQEQFAVIPELGWRVKVTDYDLVGFEENDFSLYDISPEASLIGKITDRDGNSITDGSALWHITKCIPGGTGKCWSEIAPDPEQIGTLVLKDIPVSRYTSGGNNKTYEISYLACRPSVAVETREIRTDTSGRMTVVPAERTYAPQYNIHRQQSRVLMSQAIRGLADVASYAGPNPYSDQKMNGLGGAAQLQLLFGSEVAETAPENNQFVVSPIDQISKRYGKLVQSTLKLFLDGSLAQGYVPGRTVRNILVFTTSRPHLYVSTVVFILLSIFVIMAHFRTPVPQFTFFAVASSLSRSEVPGVFEGIKHRDGDTVPERLAVQELRDRPIALEGHPGLSPTAIRLR